MSELFALEIEWDRAGLPSMVGPFPTRTEAEEWAVLNVINGSWNVSPLAAPYARGSRS